MHEIVQSIVELQTKYLKNISHYNPPPRMYLAFFTQLQVFFRRKFEKEKNNSASHNFLTNNGVTQNPFRYQEC